ncbi:MAG: paraquat-inducible protein A [Chitinophagaceae bacterium]
MKKLSQKRTIALIILGVSVAFFIMGFMYPLLHTGIAIGSLTLESETIYLQTSFRYFFKSGEVFIGLLLLFFTIIFPIIKYIFLFTTLSGIQLPRHQAISTILEIINKWAMLDVFVVAVIMLNLKFDSDVIISEMGRGTNLFAISILLLMTSSFIAGKYLKQKLEEPSLS